MRNQAISIVFASFLQVLPGCIDASPSVFPVDAGVDASSDALPPDDSAEGGDPNSACRACFAAPEVPGPGCDKFAQCQTQPSCLDVFECGFQRGCWSRDDQSDITGCALECITSLGLQLDNPGVQTIIAMGPCLQMQCRPFCHDGAPWPPPGRDPNAACRACFAAPDVPGPGCGAPYQTCAGIASCTAIYNCGFTNGCWSMSNPTDVNACGLSCIQSLGLGFEDPGVQALLGMQPCLFNACKPFCSEGAPWPPQ